MPRFRVQVQADALATLLREYLRVAPLALEHVIEQIGYVDGHPAHTAGHGVEETSVRRGPTFVDADGHQLRCREVEGRLVACEVVQRVCGHVRPCPDHDTPVAMTSVDRAAIARADLVATLHQIDDDTRTLAQVINSALHVARQALGQRAPKVEVPQCNRGVGRDGVIEWGRPWCNAVPDETRAGMCDECWQAEAAWREAHELAPRHRTSPAGPPPVLCSRDGCTRDATPGRTDGLCDAHRMADSRARRRSEDVA